MKANSVMLNSHDNVVTVTKAIKKDEDIVFLNNEKMITIKAITDIPPWNKIAIEAISKGSNILKYGEIIGAATEDITRGAYVSHLNIVSLPRDYNKEIE